MSPAALRAEAARLDDLALRFDAEARVVPGLLDTVAARMGPDVWRGPAADEFSLALGRWRTRLETGATDLLGVARRLRARAEELRAEASRIEAAQAEAAAERRALAGAGGLRVR